MPPRLLPCASLFVRNTSATQMHAGRLLTPAISNILFVTIPQQECSHLCGALVQVKHKYNGMMANIFKETFWWLPLAHVLNRRVLVVHGGLFSQDGVKLDDIRAVNRYRCEQPGAEWLRTSMT